MVQSQIMHGSPTRGNKGPASSAPPTPSGQPAARRWPEPQPAGSAPAAVSAAAVSAATIPTAVPAAPPRGGRSRAAAAARLGVPIRFEHRPLLLPNAQLGLTQWEVPLNTGAPPTPPQYAAAPQPQQQQQRQAWGSPNPGLSRRRGDRAGRRSDHDLPGAGARGTAAMEAVEKLQARGGASSVRGYARRSSNCAPRCRRRDEAAVAQ